MGKVKKKSPAKHKDSSQQKISAFFQNVNQDLNSSAGGDVEKDEKWDPYTIPETQDFKSPVSYSMSDKGLDNNADVSDSVIIPGTPQLDTDIEGRKKHFSRSFLTSASSVTERPGKHTAKERLKNMSQARRGLLSVSVKFNHNTDGAREGWSDTVVGDPQQGKCEQAVCSRSLMRDGSRNDTCTSRNSVGASDNLAQNPSISDPIVSSDLLTSLQQSGSADLDTSDDDIVYDTWALCVKSSENRTEDKENCEEPKETPTKVYHGRSLKRMSKVGISPRSKRNIAVKEGSNTDSKHDKSESSESSEFELSFDEEEDCNGKQEQRKNYLADDVESVRKTLKIFEKKTGKKYLKGHAIAMYKNQLTMKRPARREAVVSTENDELLGELLVELENNSRTVSASQKREQSKSRRSLGKKKDVSVRQGLKCSPFNADEMRYFDTLDKEVHGDIDTLGTNTDECASSKTLHILEDDKLAVFQPVKLKKLFKSKSPQGSEGIHVISNQFDQLQNSSASTLKDDIKSKLNPTQLIGDFPTQETPMGTCTSPGEIEEFQESQMDAALLTDSFTISPTCPDSQCLDPAPCERFGRHVVKSVRNLVGHVELLLRDTNREEDRRCLLEGFWCDTHVNEGDLVHVLGQFDRDGVCHITDTEGLLIVNPDRLLSGTTIVSSVFCMRKSILNEKFKGVDKGNVQMLYGSIIHQLFQQVLQKKMYEEDGIMEEAHGIVKQLNFLHDMYGSNITEEEVMQEIDKYIPPLQKWLHQYTTIGKERAQMKPESDIAILNVKDIEENIWSPRYGLKGKIDLTVDVKIRKKGAIERKTVPLELKTGRPTFSVEHKGQVTLYSMMSGDRREDPGQGLLLYLKEPDMKLIPADHLSKRGLIQLRNEMAYYLSQRVCKSDNSGTKSFMLGRLPEPVNNPRACSKCPQLLNCSAYQRCIEQRDLPSSHAMSTLVPETLQHLSEAELSYFTHWCLLLDLEMKAGLTEGGIRDIWCKSGTQREEEGDCISGLRLDTSPQTEREQIYVKFVRQKTLANIGLATHDYVIVSTEDCTHIAVCTGTILEISDGAVILLTERESLPRLQELEGVVYRVDKYDGYNTSALLYCNISYLLRNEPHSARLRDLIINKRRPEFVNKLSKGEIEKVKSVFKPLNKPQKIAILKVLMAKDYVLMKGFPGTGKTTTIVSLVEVLTKLGKTVLLTSYTHSAVDNILLKLRKIGVGFLRLGKISKIHPGIHPYTAEKLTKEIQTVEELRQFYQSQQVVATSSLGVNHTLFSQRRFDVCIIDEASQILQPASLGPLFSADKFVLVGDPKQLPPVVQGRDARDLGMDESLFTCLDTGVATFDLNLQYRMNRDIMYLSNCLVYDGALRCGNDDVANSRLVLPLPVTEVLTLHPWLEPVFSAEPYRATIFFNTAMIPAPEVRDHSGLIKNVVESQIVHCIARSCCQCGIKEEDIGVIAPYRHQVSLIRSELALFRGIEVNTVDQYQGRDKDIIIISFTRSISQQPERKLGQLLTDVRRLNVAITRAKKKLILVGDTTTLTHYPPMAQIISLMEHHIYHIPK